MYGSFSRTEPLRPVMSLNKMLTMSRVHARREEPNCQDISTAVLENLCRTIESHERTSTPQLNTPVAMNESHEFDYIRDARVIHPKWQEVPKLQCAQSLRQSALLARIAFGDTL